MSGVCDQRTLSLTSSLEDEFGVTPTVWTTGGGSDTGELTLRGRRYECSVLDGLLQGARGGRSGTLVLQARRGLERPRCWSM
jgi:hypothetical protein